MKFKTLIFFLLLIPLLVESQEIEMRIAKKDGTVQSFPIGEIRKITFSGLIGINESEMPKIVSNLMLLNNYPNPFASSTTIEFELPENGYVHATIIDFAGKQIKSLVSRELFKGKNEVTWDGCNQSGESVTPGMYLCIVKYSNQVFSRKLIFIK